jgi:hypothetical protein
MYYCYCGYLFVLYLYLITGLLIQRRIGLNYYVAVVLYNIKQLLYILPVLVICQRTTILAG